MSNLQNLRILTRTTYTKIDPNAKVRSDTTLNHYINEAQNQIIRDMNFDIPECESSTTITTTWGTTEYNKPTDFQRIVGFFQDGYKLTNTTKQQFLLNRSSNTKPSSYYIYGSKIWFYPTPDNTYTFDLLYKRKLPTITETIDCELPSDYDNAISLYSCYLMMISVEKQAKANMAIMEYNNEISKLYNQYVNNDDNISFSLQRSNDRTREDAL